MESVEMSCKGSEGQLKKVIGYRSRWRGSDVRES